MFSHFARSRFANRINLADHLCSMLGFFSPEIRTHLAFTKKARQKRGSKIAVKKGDYH
jgi:hypothetical protein